jgi:hypothetical protein
MEYYLSSYKNSIGIGEAYKAMRNFQNNGLQKLSEFDQSLIKTNRFWKEIYSRTSKFSNAEDQYLDMYKHLFDSSDFSEYETVIDSSKNLEGLRILSKKYHDCIEVLIIYKDVRSWIVSMVDNYKRKSRKIPFAFAYRLAWKWFKTYESYHKELKLMNINHHHISYDLFCINHEASQNNLKHSVRLKGEPNTRETNSINILGNRMKKEANKELIIRYDYRWLKRNEWEIPWFLLPPSIKKINNDYVWTSDITSKQES